MDLLKSIFLGIIQGLTEFLPISSSGHLVLAKHFIGFEQGISYEIFLHLGSLVAVCLYFRVYIGELICGVIHFRKPDNRKYLFTCLWLGVATIVTGVIGFLCKDFFEGMFLPLHAAVWIFITGVLLLISDRIGEGNFDIHQLGWKRSLFIGFGQAMAITPGLSRSGTTIVFSLLSRLKRQEAATFSFLLSVPAIIGANLSEYKALSSLQAGQAVNYFTGFVMAFISGYLVINWLIKLIVKARLRYFAYYCFAFSIICIGLILYGK